MVDGGMYKRLIGCYSYGAAAAMPSLRVLGLPGAAIAHKPEASAGLASLQVIRCRYSAWRSYACHRLRR